MEIRATSPTRRMGVAAASVVAVWAMAACSSSEGASDRADNEASATSGAAPTIEGVVELPVDSANHTDDPVVYDHVPPVGGDHAPVWQNCAAYPAPIPTERGVHSLEHGAVWITHRPDLDPAAIDALGGLAGPGEYVLVSPWASELTSPIVLSAWGAQLKVDDPADPRVAEFLVAYRQALTSPEPGAPCSGGSSESS